MTTAAEKLSLGMQRLSDAGDDPLLLGQALLTLHGALEDHFDEWLSTCAELPLAERETLGEQGWPARIRQMQTYGTLSQQHATTITRFNRLRTRVAHGDDFTLSRAELEGYTQLVRALIHATPLATVSSRTSSSHGPAARADEPVVLDFSFWWEWVIAHVLWVTLWMAIGYAVGFLLSLIFGSRIAFPCVYIGAGLGIRKAQRRTLPYALIDQGWLATPVLSGGLASLIANSSKGNPILLLIAAVLVAGAIDGVTQWRLIAPLPRASLWLDRKSVV